MAEKIKVSEENTKELIKTLTVAARSLTDEEVTLRVTGKDLSLTLTSPSCRVSISSGTEERKGPDISVVLPKTALVTMLKSCSSSLVLSVAAKTVSISSGTSSFSLRKLSTLQRTFPTRVWNLETKTSLDILKDSHESVSWSVARTIDRVQKAFQTCLNVTVRAGKLLVVGCNDKSFCTYRSEIKGADLDLVLPVQVMDILKTQDDSEVTISKDESAALFSTKNLQVVSVLLDSKCKDFTPYLNRADYEDPTKISLTKDQVKSLSSDIAVLSGLQDATNRYITLSIVEGVLTLQAAASAAKGSLPQKCVVTGEDVILRVDPVIFRSAISSPQTDVVVHLKKPRDLAKITAEKYVAIFGTDHDTQR